MIGPSFARAEMPDVIERLIETYLERAQRDERFIDIVQRIGIEPFKERVYGHDSSKSGESFTRARPR